MNEGDVYFKAFGDDETGKVEIDTYVLRTIRGAHGYLVLKCDFTWGKKSKKHGDFGWLDPIPEWVRNRFRIENGVPKGFAKSKSQALRAGIANEKDLVANGFGSDQSQTIIQTMESRLKREMTKKKKERANDPSRAGKPQRGSKGRQIRAGAHEGVIVGSEALEGA